MSSVRSQDIDALDKFIHYFNIVYPDWKIYRDSSVPLQTSHVEYGSVSHCSARCGSSRYGNVSFEINPGWWGESTEEEQLGLLTHELAHIQFANHKPEFWDQVVTVYHRLEDHADRVAEVTESPLNWEEVTKWIVTDPSTTSVDNRSELVFERRRTLAKQLGYPIGELEPFGGIDAFWVKADNTKKLPWNELTYTEYSRTELENWFVNPGNRSGVEKCGDRFHIEYPVAVESGDKVTVQEGHPRVDLQRYLSSRERVVVQIQE